MNITIGSTSSFTPDGLLFLLPNTSGTMVAHNAYTTYGVTMGDDFINTLKEPIALKQFVESKSRLQHGKRVVVEPNNKKMDSRDFTLTFVICGASRTDFETKKANFFNDILYAGRVCIAMASEYVMNGTAKNYTAYNLIYQGQNATYGQNLYGTICKLAAKFEEPNPDDRLTLGADFSPITVGE